MIIIQFIIGSVFGSFISLMNARQYQKNENIIFPRSHCDYCMHNLHYYEMIPIISFIGLRGKCSKCKHSIGISNLFIEIISGLIWISYPFNLNGILSIIFWSIILFLSISDIKYLTIPTSFILILLINVGIIKITNNEFNISKFIIIFLLYLAFTIINNHFNKIGNGDIDIIFILIWLSNYQIITLTIFISSILAIILYFIKRPLKYIPYIPFISIGYLLTINLFPKLFIYM